MAIPSIPFSIPVQEHVYICNERAVVGPSLNTSETTMGRKCLSQAAMRLPSIRSCKQLKRLHACSCGITIGTPCMLRYACCRGACYARRLIRMHAMAVKPTGLNTLPTLPKGPTAVSPSRPDAGCCCWRRLSAACKGWQFQPSLLLTHASAITRNTLARHGVAAGSQTSHEQEDVARQ